MRSGRIERKSILSSYHRIKSDWIPLFWKLWYEHSRSFDINNGFINRLSRYKRVHVHHILSIFTASPTNATRTTKLSLYLLHVSRYLVPMNSITFAAIYCTNTFDIGSMNLTNVLWISANFLRNIFIAQLKSIASIQRALCAVVWSFRFIPLNTDQHQNICHQMDRIALSCLRN